MDRLKTIFAVGLLLTTNLAFAGIDIFEDLLGLEYNQCNRKCREAFPVERGIVGVKIKGEEWCKCKVGDEVKGVVARLNPDRPPIEPGAVVCAEDTKAIPQDPNRVRQYESMAEMVLAGAKFLNKGPCGKCSNSDDIGIYAKTAKTLTNTTTQCAFDYILFGEEASRKCFKQVGLTPGCSECWIDNIGCDASHCLETCLLQKLRPRLFDRNNTTNGDLNDCLRCDENRCGTAFIECAGANRRRSGIESDIEREPGEIATVDGGTN